MFQGLFYASMQELFMLYLVELVTLIYMIYKYRKSVFHVLIILLFYQAIFFFIGKDVSNIYKIITLAITLYICEKRRVFSRFKSGDSTITFLFALFSISYLFSAISNNDTITIILSQYSRYAIAYCMWFLVRSEIYEQKYDLQVFFSLIYDIFLMQIIISLGKFAVFSGKQHEGLVGSMSHTGGSDGTTIPIVGFIFLWLYKQGKLLKKDWLFVGGLMLLGFLAGKRAVWFMMPIVIALFYIYVPKLKINGRLWAVILASPLAFYLGVRLTPTLNPEHKVWGSFDYEYALDYADKYQFGDETKKENRAQGRGGATFLLFSKLTDDSKLTQNDLFGFGLGKMYSTDYGQFDQLNLGIAHKGNATGFFQSYLTIGYIGMLFLLLFNLSIFLKIKATRIKWVIFSIICWEYFMYIGRFFREPAYMFMFIVFIHYTNYQYKLHQQYKHRKLSEV